MMYSPHILQKKVASDAAEDEYGHPVAGTEEWIDICRCRCDDNTTKYFTSENGSVYTPAYHVVADKTNAIKVGDEIRCMDGELVRGNGKAYMVKNTNYFNFTEIWI